MQTDGKITYLPLDEYRYLSMLEHLTWLAKQPGAHDYATKRSRELARTEPDVYANLPKDLWAILKVKDDRPIQN